MTVTIRLSNSEYTIEHVMSIRWVSMGTYAIRCFGNEEVYHRDVVEISMRNTE